MSQLEPYFKPFEKAESYTQDDAEGLSFRKILPEGIVPDVDMGMVTATGPVRKFPGIHQTHHQIYLVIQGTGYVYLSTQKIRIDQPGLVLIPCDTEHSIQVDPGQTMKYIYVNRWISADSVK